MSGEHDATLVERQEVEFLYLSRAVLVAAYRRVHEPQFHPSFDGKPLNFLELTIRQDIIDDTIEDVIDERQEDSTLPHRKTLTVKPFRTEDFLNLKRANSHNHLPTDTLSYYQQIASLIGGVSIDASWSITTLPIGAVTATYQAQSYHHTEQHASRQPNPNPKTLRAGISFANIALGYVASNDFREVQQGNLVCSASATHTISHELTFEHDPTLPLNGHESTAFLQAHRQSLTAQIGVKMRHIEDLKMLGDSDRVQPELIALDQLQNALDTTNDILQKRR